MWIPLSISKKTKKAEKYVYAGSQSRIALVRNALTIYWVRGRFKRCYWENSWLMHLLNICRYLIPTTKVLPPPWIDAEFVERMSPIGLYHPSFIPPFLNWKKKQERPRIGAHMKKEALRIRRETQKNTNGITGLEGFLHGRRHCLCSKAILMGWKA